MTEIEVTAKKWGDSIAVIIPKKIAKEEHIKLNQKFTITIKRTADLSDIFGKLKTIKTAQQLKNETKRGWD